MSVFESVFSNIPSFVYRSKNAGDCEILSISSGVRDLLGYDPQKVVNNPRLSFAVLTHPDDFEATCADIKAASQAGLPWDIVFRMLHANGSPVWVRQRGKAVVVDGEITCLEGLIVCAEDEMKARHEMERLLAETKASNREIVQLTGNILQSIRALKMLSVNARIEAMRSGEAGLGFTIVAEEMKKLADQNAEWARIITEKITKVSG